MTAAWAVEMLFTLFFCVFGRCRKAVEDDSIIGAEVGYALETKATAFRAAGRFFRFALRFHAISIPNGEVMPEYFLARS